MKFPAKAFWTWGLGPVLEKSSSAISWSGPGRARPPAGCAEHSSECFRSAPQRAWRGSGRAPRTPFASKLCASKADAIGRFLHGYCKPNSSRHRHTGLTPDIPAQKVFCILAYNMSAGVVSNCSAHTKAFVSSCLVAKSPSAEAVSNCPVYTKPIVSNFRALLNIYYYIAIGHPQLLTAMGGGRARRSLC